MLSECLVLVLTTVGIYGIGMNRVVVLSSGKKGIVLAYIKSLLSSVATVSLVYLLVQGLLVPVGMQELYPMVCILVFCFMAAFFEVIVRLTAKTDVAEFAVSFLCVLLAINESVSMVEAVLFVICCLTSFYVSIPILYAIRKRNESANSITIFKNSLVLFSFAALVLMLLAFDVSWLNGGVVR